MEIWWNSRKSIPTEWSSFSLYCTQMHLILCVHIHLELVPFPVKRVSKFGPLACKCLDKEKTLRPLIIGGSSMVNIDEETRRREKINDQEKFEKEQRERQENDKEKLINKIWITSIMQLRDQSNQHQGQWNYMRELHNKNIRSRTSI